jgi:filamentous hemagglutinin family protein
MPSPLVCRMIGTPGFKHCLSARLGVVVVVPLSALIFSPAAYAGAPLPQGGQFVSGQGSIAGDGHGIVITQPGSTRGVIDWRSFSIAQGNSVTINNGSGATLNRVTGGSPSAILGSLSATGSLYLINPQGILVGVSGVVSTGGRFVASTLDLPNTAFMNGGTLMLAGSSNAKVVNLGKISSSDGDVFLIARDAVVNGGTVSAPNGTAEYVAGQQVVLFESSSSRQVFVLTSSKGTVVDRGVTQAAQINLEAADGNVYALAGSGTRIRATGTATRDGHIWLVADNGHVTQQGTITATNADASGGTVDTLANTLTLAGDATVKAALWNVSTPSFTVDTATAGAFVRSLNAATSVDAIATGTNGTTGDLNVVSNMTWQGPAALSLVAFHNVTVAPGTTLKNTGGGNLSLRADAAGIDNTGSVANRGTIDWSGSTGFVRSFYDMNGSYSPGVITSNAAWTAAAESGLVTQVTGYKLINSLDGLVKVSSDLAGNYALGKDIDATTPLFGPGTYVPIGSAATPFTGQFEGMGHTVSKLQLTTSALVSPRDGPVPEEDASGLFGVIGKTGVVRNINVDGNGSLAMGEYGGYSILAGDNYGTIANAHASGTISSLGDINRITGGLVGQNFGTVTRSSSDVIISTEGQVGGLVGVNGPTGIIRQSYSSDNGMDRPVFQAGTVNAFGHATGGGGLVGNNEGLITESYTTAPMTFMPDTCGFSGRPCGSGSAALVERNSGRIEQSFATGAVTTSVVPGFGPPALGIASNNDGTIAKDVFWNVDTTHATLGVYLGTGVSAATGLTTAQMSTPASFGPTYDFSSTGVWALPAGATHPVLRWQLAN